MVESFGLRNLDFVGLRCAAPAVVCPKLAEFGSLSSFVRTPWRFGSGERCRSQRWSNKERIELWTERSRARYKENEQFVA